MRVSRRVLKRLDEAVAAVCSGHVDRKYSQMKTPPSSGAVGHLDIRPGRIRSVSERRALFSIVKPPRARRVLLVEDDRDVRRIISLALRRAAIEVVEAETAEQARRIFENAG